MKIPKHVTIVLNETHTIFLLDLPSSVACKDSDEGRAADVDNQLYHHLTKGKGRNRKLVTISTQTVNNLHKTRSTEPEHCVSSDRSTFASNWEMYDTYKTTQKEQEQRENNDIFHNAVLIIERLLANNSYNNEQKVFKGICESDSEVFEYNYKLNLLWTFSNDSTKKRCVTGLSLNPKFEDIIAVSYGKYYFTDRKNIGLVMVWNIKNPKQPERQYSFVCAVTCIAFSKASPNHLAVGFYNGTLDVVDISKRHLDVVWQDATSFEPVWDVLWLSQAEEHFLIVCFGDGRIRKYKPFQTSMQIMRVEKVGGKLKGLQTLRMFEGDQVASSLYSSAVRLSRHPEDDRLYVVGTNEGLIHKYRTDCTSKHLSVFKAHDGAVNAIKFSPFASKVFATCGDDFRECFWIEGIDEPLIVSRFSTEPVLDVEWSPSHSTILASLRGTEILLWDIQRKMYCPQSRTESPTNSPNTLCRFTSCGRCLLVGDVDGNVHVFSVTGLPHPAFFQENCLATSLKTILATNAKLAKNFNQTGRLTFDA